MPVQSSNTKDVYNGNGVTTEWPITFQVNGGDNDQRLVISEDEVLVYITDEDGISTLLEEDYEVDLNNLVVTYPTVASALEPLPTGQKIVLKRWLEFTQETDYKNQGSLPAETIQLSVDRLTMICQQLLEEIDRANQVDVSENEPDEDLTAILAQVLAALAAVQAALAAALAAQAAAEAAQAAAEAAAESAENFAANGFFSIAIDGGGQVIETGIRSRVYIPISLEIEEVTIGADQMGSIVIDAWMDTYANFPPTDADSITASAPVTLSTAIKNQDSTLTGWTTTIPSGGRWLFFNVDSVSTLTYVSLTFKVRKL